MLAMLGAMGVGFGAIGLTGACSGPSDPNIGVDLPPSDATNWHPVADFMTLRCGTLDCHGNVQRNFVIWGCNGHRLETGEGGLTPGCARQGGTNTTDDEYNATYRSLVGLEPATISFVVQNHGSDPELLTFIRKARNEETHKGNQLVVPGDEQDDCMTSWLTGTTNLDACKAAITFATNVGVAPVTGDAGP